MQRISKIPSPLQLVVVFECILYIANHHPQKSRTQWQETGCGARIHSFCRSLAKVIALATWWRIIARVRSTEKLENVLEYDVVGEQFNSSKTVWHWCTQICLHTHTVWASIVYFWYTCLICLIIFIETLQICRQTVSCVLYTVFVFVGFVSLLMFDLAIYLVSLNPLGLICAHTIQSQHCLHHGLPWVQMNEKSSMRFHGCVATPFTMLSK